MDSKIKVSFIYDDCLLIILKSKKRKNLPGIRQKDKTSTQPKNMFELVKTFFTMFTSVLIFLQFFLQMYDLLFLLLRVILLLSKTSVGIEIQRTNDNNLIIICKIYLYVVMFTTTTTVPALLKRTIDAKYLEKRN